MKRLIILSYLSLTGCVSVDMSGVVSDTVKASKDAYKAVVGEKAKPAAEPFAVSHSYIGKDTQTIGEVKKKCVEEAEQKLQQVIGKQVRYTVTQNDVLTINTSVVANCKLVAADL